MPFPAGSATNPGQFVHPVIPVQYRLWPRTHQAATGQQNWAGMEFPASGKADGSGLYEHAHLPLGKRYGSETEYAAQSAADVVHEGFG